VEFRFLCPFCGQKLKADEDADAPFVFIGRSSERLFSIHRDRKGGGCPQNPYDESKKVKKDQAVSFRISERGSSFVTEYLLDGTNWTRLTPSDGYASSTTWKENRLVGLAICSGSTNSTVTPWFDVPPNSPAPIGPQAEAGTTVPVGAEVDSVAIRPREERAPRDKR